jgi:1,4-alpha-glucan branching enzyme
MNQILKIKKVFFIIAIFIISKSTIFAVEPINWYSLMLLKESQAPQPIKLLNTEMRPKRRAIESGILFTYSHTESQNVSISGDFSNWTPVKMKRGKNGVWFYFLAEYKDRSQIRYKFLVNNIWVTDPSNPDTIDDGYGSYLSIAKPYSSKNSRHLSYKFVSNQTIKFRIYNKSASLIAIVGDFNNWNPEHDLLTKGKNNVWTITKKLQPGKYRYKFIIDGKWTHDIYNNKNAADNTGGIASLIQIK